MIRSAASTSETVVGPDDSGPAPAAPSATIDGWLDVFVRLTRLPPVLRHSIRDELATHLHARARDLMIGGMSEPDAVRHAPGELGDLAELARRFETANRPSLRRRIMNVCILTLGAGTLLAGVIAIATPRAPITAAVFNPPAGQTSPPESLHAVKITLPEGTTLEAFIERLRENVNRGVVIRWAELAEVDIDSSTVLPLQVTDAPLPVVLDAVAESLGTQEAVAWRFYEDRVELGLRDAFDRREVTLVSYAVADILHTIVNTCDSTHDDAVEQVLELITNLVEPDAWTAMGGDRAQAHIVAGRLFIQAPPRMQERVEWILARLSESGQAGHAGAGGAGMHSGDFTRPIEAANARAAGAGRGVSGGGGSMR